MLVVGGGVGASARELAKHPTVEEIHLCEIDKVGRAHIASCICCGIHCWLHVNSLIPRPFRKGLGTRLACEMKYLIL